MIVSEVGPVFVIGRTSIFLDGHGWLEDKRDGNLR